MDRLALDGPGCRAAYAERSERKGRLGVGLICCLLCVQHQKQCS